MEDYFESSYIQSIIEFLEDHDIGEEQAIELIKKYHVIIEQLSEQFYPDFVADNLAFAARVNLSISDWQGRLNEANAMTHRILSEEEDHTFLPDIPHVEEDEIDELRKIAPVVRRVNGELLIDEEQDPSHKSLLAEKKWKAKQKEKYNEK